MRVRLFFWLILAFTCMSVSIFAATYRPHVPALLRIHGGTQHFVAQKTAVLDLELTDEQGLPIELAHITPIATMTNMPMTADQSEVKALGQGHYQIVLELQMAGPWAIHIQAVAEGFTPLSKVLAIQVE